MIQVRAFPAKHDEEQQLLDSLVKRIPRCWAFEHYCSPEGSFPSCNVPLVTRRLFLAQGMLFLKLANLRNRPFLCHLSGNMKTVKNRPNNWGMKGTFSPFPSHASSSSLLQLPARTLSLGDSKRLTRLLKIALATRHAHYQQKAFLQT